MSNTEKKLSFVSRIKNICPNWARPLGREVLGFYNSLHSKLIYVIYAGRTLLHPECVVLNCTCCGSRFISFSEGAFINRPDCYDTKRYEHIRQDVICPCCRSLPRHRILAVWCQENLATLKDKPVLYFAPENGMDRWMKRKGITVTTADLYTSADLKLDLDHIDQPNASWDVVFCNHVLEHVPDYKKALHELYRILKPGGMLICSFPIDIRYETVQEDDALIGDDSPQADRERICKFGQKDHLRVFGRDSRKLLEEAGFVVSVIDGDTMPEEIMPVVGPADYDSNKLFVCEKR